MSVEDCRKECLSLEKEKGIDVPYFTWRGPDSTANWKRYQDSYSGQNTCWCKSAIPKTKKKLQRVNVHSGNVGCVDEDEEQPGEFYNLHITF